MILIFLKIIITIGVVLTLSQIAERLSPRWAGLLGGYPLGTALVLIFIGYEEGVEFAALSALHTVTGLSANLAVMAAYGITLILKPKASPWLCATFAILSFCSVGFLLRLFEFNMLTALLFILPVIFFCIFSFRRFPEHQIKASIGLSYKVTFLRAGAAAASVLIITGLAQQLGPVIAGILASFPVTVFPLILIIHLTYGPDPVLTIIKHFPSGLGAMLIFAIIFSLYLQQLGLFHGIVLSFACATVYLLVFSWGQQKMRQRMNPRAS